MTGGATGGGGLTTVDVVVVGAGQGGLASTHHLLRAGLAPGRGVVVLDGGDAPGGAWRHRWPTLTMARVNGVHDLPGLSMAQALGPVAPGARAADVVPAYFAAYEEHLGHPVRRPVRVAQVSAAGGRLLVDTSAGRFAARAVVSATGTWTRPFWPALPGRDVFTGRQLHTADYRGPEGLRGCRVLVVGGGVSAVQHLAELAGVAASTTWVTRSEPVFVEVDASGALSEEQRRAAVARVAARVAAGRPPGSVVSATGLPLTPEVRELRERGVLRRSPVPQRLTASGARWADGSEEALDVVLWATGFRAALEHLRPLGLREPGGGVLLDGTRSVREPRLHLVGHGASASTVGASRAAREAVRAVLAGR